MFINKLMRRWCSVWPVLYNTITIDTRNEDVVNQEVPPERRAKNSLCIVFVLGDYMGGSVSSMDSKVFNDHLARGKGTSLDYPFQHQTVLWAQQVRHNLQRPV